MARLPVARASLALRLTMTVAVAALAAACGDSKSSVVASGGGGTGNQGLYKVGRPYQIFGRTYYPKEDFGLVETGVASWYGPGFHGKQTANGEIFDENDMTAAHRTLQMPSMVRVTNLENGRSIALRVNDRGPFAHDRVIDVSRRGAQLLGFERQGVARVRVEVMREESEQLAAIARAGGSTTAMAAVTSPVQTAPVQTAPVQTAAQPAPSLPATPTSWARVGTSADGAATVHSSAAAAAIGPGDPTAVPAHAPPAYAPPGNPVATDPPPTAPSAVPPAAPPAPATRPAIARAELAPPTKLAPPTTLAPPTVLAPPAAALPAPAPRPAPRAPAYAAPATPPPAYAPPAYAPPAYAPPAYAPPAYTPPAAPASGGGFLIGRANAAEIPLAAQGTARGTVQGAGYHYVQTGAFADPGNAERQRRVLAGVGDVRVAPATVSGQPLYRVRVGPFASADEADRVLDRVAAAGYPGARIVVE